jgi:hypothetical protein
VPLDTAWGFGGSPGRIFDADSPVSQAVKSEIERGWNVDNDKDAERNVPEWISPCAFTSEIADVPRRGTGGHT